MTGAHPDIGPELRKLAQVILDGIDPGVRAAAARAAANSAGTGKCQQVWCPVCALAALVIGEQHPLLTIVAEHSVVLLEAVRAFVGQIDTPSTPHRDGPPNGRVAPGSVTGDARVGSRYQSIPVTLDE